VLGAHWGTMVGGERAMRVVEGHFVGQYFPFLLEWLQCFPVLLELPVPFD